LEKVARLGRSVIEKERERVWVKEDLLAAPMPFWTALRGASLISLN